MPFYMVQAAYTPAKLQAMLTVELHGRGGPGDGNMGVATLTPIAEGFGGKLDGRAWVSFGEYDVVGIIEMPDNVSAAAVSMKLSLTGDYRAVKTTPLFTTEEGRAALRRAGGI